MSQARKDPELRKSDFIDAEVQWALARRLLCHWLLFVVASLTLVFLLEWMASPLVSVGEVFQESFTSFVPMAISFLALVPVLIYDAMKFSNRFAGPAFRIHSVIRKLADGDTSGHINLRQDDYWQAIGQDVNRLIDRVGGSQGENVSGSKDILGNEGQR